MEEIFICFMWDGANMLVRVGQDDLPHGRVRAGY